MNYKDLGARGNGDLGALQAPEPLVYTLTVASASLTITATTVTVTSRRSLAVGSAAEAITPTDVVPRYVRVLSVFSASVAITASAVTLVVHRQVVVGAATISTTATDVTPSLVRRVTVGSASLAITFGSVDVVWIHILPATDPPSIAAPRQLLEVCEIDLPGETVRVAQVPYASLSRGLFEPAVRAFGAIQLMPSDRDGSLSASETTIDLDDTSRVIAQIEEGQNAHQVVGSPCRRYLADQTKEFGDWTLLWSGEIVKPLDTPEVFVKRLTARVSDAPLSRKAPYKSWTIDRTSCPNARPDVIGKTAPRVYGIHDSTNFRTSPGMLLGYCLDTKAKRYGFSAGRLLSIDAVFSADELMGSGWAVEYWRDRRGQLWTTVTFTDDQEDKVITANAHGYESNGDLSGTLIEAPTEQLAHMLSNFHFATWTSGSSWLPTNARIGASLSGAIADFLEARVPTAAPCYTDRITGLQVVSDFCRDHGVRAYWGPESKLEFCVEDVALDAPYAASEIDWEREIYKFSIAHDDVDVASSVRVEHARAAADGKALSSFGVTLPDSPDDEADELPLIWAAAS